MYLSRAGITLSVRRLVLPLGAVAALLAGITGAAVPAGTAGAQTTPSGVSVSVNPTSTLAVVPSTAIGLNASTYDANLADPSVPGLLRNAGISLMRFPGGTESDQYNWKTNTDVLSNAAQAANFDQFMAVVRKAGAQAMVTVNYGTGNAIGQSETPAKTGAQVAADWVYYANVLHHYNVRYWEIGNEVYGNGTYGADWEPDDHCQVSSTGGSPFQPNAGAAFSPETPGTGQAPTYNCGPAVYAANALQYIDAMKAVDPNITVGIVLTAPNNWPDDNDIGYICGSGSTEIPNCYWDATVLKDLAGHIGFADIHWYPQNPSNVTAYSNPPLTNGAPGNPPTDAGLLASTSNIPGMLATLRQRFAQYGDGNIPIMVTETNSVSSNPGKQTLSVVNALYLEQDYLTWLENGVANVDWWQLHNGIGTTGDNGPADNASQDPTAPALYGATLYGDYGVLSNGSCGTTPSYATPANTQVCEPPADTPFPAYYGLEMLSRFIQPGDALLGTTSSQGLVQAYAERGPGQQLRIMLVNDDPSNGHAVNLSVPGYAPRPGSSVLSYGEASTSPSSRHFGTGPFVVPPYSVTVVTLQRMGPRPAG
ncbi:MAG: cellulose-binding protein [Acidimicrobiales bacterium]|jgi:hypothetical protein